MSVGSNGTQTREERAVGVLERDRTPQGVCHPHPQATTQYTFYTLASSGCRVMCLEMHFFFCWITQTRRGGVNAASFQKGRPSEENPGVSLLFPKVIASCPSPSNPPIHTDTHQLHSLELVQWLREPLTPGGWVTRLQHHPLVKLKPTGDRQHARFPAAMCSDCFFVFCFFKHGKTKRLQKRELE